MRWAWKQQVILKGYLSASIWLYQALPLHTLCKGRAEDLHDANHDFDLGHHRREPETRDSLGGDKMHYDVRDGDRPAGTLPDRQLFRYHGFLNQLCGAHGHGC